MMKTARFFLNDPRAPKPNRPTHLGVNVLILWDGKLLLEQRRDCCAWGLIGGGVRGREESCRAAIREVREETGIRLCPDSLERLGIIEDRERIASYPDGSVWRMIIVLYRAELTAPPQLTKSGESCSLAFFSREELRNLPIVETHRDLVPFAFLPPHERLFR